MFRRQEETNHEMEPKERQQRVTSVLGQDMSWNGELSGEGGVRIEGAFEGKIDIDGLLVVDRNGRVTSDGIQARSVIVSGAVRSDVKAERVEIRSSGRIWGNVVTKSLSTEEGAYLKGKIEMEEEQEEREEDSDMEAKEEDEHAGEGDEEKA